MLGSACLLLDRSLASALGLKNVDFSHIAQILGLLVLGWSHTFMASAATVVIPGMEISLSWPLRSFVRCNARTCENLFPPTSAKKDLTLTLPQIRSKLPR